MGSVQSLKEALEEELERLNKAAEETLLEDDLLKHLFVRNIKVFNIILKIADNLPIERELWLYGDNFEDNRMVDITFIREQLILSILYASLKRWEVANHMARCSLEHTLQFIWKIGRPIKWEKIENEDSNPRYKDIIKGIFEIPEFETYNEEYLIEDEIIDLYSKLSNYVHSSNVLKREERKDRPHVSKDIGPYHEIKDHTKNNLKNTFDIIVTLLCLTYRNELGSDEKEKLKEIISEKLYDEIFSFIDVE